MAIFIADLDDTLIDRQAAFWGWAKSFVDSHALPDGSLEWLLEHDFGRGTVTLDAFLDRVETQYALPITPDQLRALFVEGMVDHLPPLSSETKKALKRLRAGGWKIAVVTNGSFDLQSRKLEFTGLTHLIDGWCISEEAGVRKPEPRIFELVAERCGTKLAGGWMVGDSPEMDIAGGGAVGLQTAWIRRGREWSRSDLEPDLVVDTVAQAASLIMELRPRQPA